MIHSFARRLFFRGLARLSDVRLEIHSPDGVRVFGPEGAPPARVDVRDERAFSRFVFGGDVAFGETYTDGLWSTPDLFALACAGLRNASVFESAARVAAAVTRLLQRVRHRFRPNSLSGSRRNIEAHYDLGNDLYSLFLDPHMAYSCAYFERPEASLEEAQEAKFERICQKLGISASHHVLEIGTGWGGFAIWAARRRGCRVTTATISRAQHDFARERIAREGLADRVTLLYEDYRRLSGTFDRIVSIEMFEAVGLERYDEFFGAAERLLTPAGAMLLQTITMNEQRFPAYRRKPDWIQLHVFPGSELACLSEVLRSIGRVSRLTLVHVEDLAAHYVRTLLTWRDRFLENRARVRALGFDDRFIRLWDYYLTSCAAGFAERYIGDVQLLFVKQPSSDRLWGEPAFLDRLAGRLEGASRVKLLARIRSLFAAELRRGLTAHQIALTLAIGLCLSVPPVLGTTTALCAIAAVALRLNQPLIQAVNVLAYPLQLFLLVPFLRAGEWLFGAPPTPLSPAKILSMARSDPLGTMSSLWTVSWHGAVVWAVASVPLALAVYALSRPRLEGLALRLARQDVQRVA